VKPAAEKIKGLIFIISGPSGSGKTTLRDKLFEDKRLKSELVKSVSLTTRKKRSGEKSGRDYFFITKDEFSSRLKANKIFEWTRYLGYYYATARDFVEKQLKQGKNIILCLDLKGAFKIKKLYQNNSVSIFVLPPSLEALRSRIRKRCSRTRKKEIGERLKLARKELLASHRYDYVLINKNLTQATKELKAIILKEISTPPHQLRK